MRTPFAALATVLGGAVLLATLGTGPAAPAADVKTIRVGLIDTLFRNDTEKDVQSLAGPFKSLLEERAGIIGDVVIGGNAENLAQELKDGKAALGVFHGFEYGWGRQKNPDMKPLIVGINQTPSVRAVVLVREDDKVADPAALKGKVLGLAQLAREQERIFVSRKVADPGTPLDKWFSKVSSPRTARDVLDYLSAKDVDAAAVDEMEWMDYRKNFPKSAGRLRVLKESEKFPPVTVAYQPDKLDQVTATRILDGMIEANKTERGRKLLDLCRLTSFQKPPADFEQEVETIVKAYPPPTTK